MSLPYVDSINLMALRSLVKSMAYEMQQVTSHLAMSVSSMMMMEQPEPIAVEETIDFFGTSEPEPTPEPPKALPREERGKGRKRDKRREAVREEQERHHVTREPESRNEEEGTKQRAQRRDKDRDRKPRQPPAGASSEPSVAEAAGTRSEASVISPLELELVDITALERQLLASPVRETKATPEPSGQHSEAGGEAVSVPVEEVSNRERKKRVRRGSRHDNKPTHKAESEAGGKPAESGKEVNQVREPTAPVREESQPPVVSPPVADQSPAMAEATPTVPLNNAGSPSEPQHGKPKTQGYYSRGGQRRENNRVGGKENRKQPRRPNHHHSVNNKGPAGGIQPPPQRNQ